MPTQPVALHGDARLSPSDHVVALPVADDLSLTGRLLAGVGRLVCRVRGHDMLPQFNSNRLFLKCVSCGHESPGWQLAGTHPVVRFRGDARRHLVDRLPVAGHVQHTATAPRRGIRGVEMPRRAAG